MAIAGTNDVNNDDKDMKAPMPPPELAAAPVARDGKEDWIGRQLRRVFDDALNEPLPDDIMSLLERIDEHPADPSSPADKAKADSVKTARTGE